jgi:hypothetical protein
MATAKQTSRTRSQPPKGRSRRFALWLGLAAIMVLALYWVPLRQTALAGTAFGARIACSCRYVAGRALSDCRDDFEPGMALVMLGEDEDTRTITARIPFIASQTATFHPGQGCLLEPWAG